MQRGGNGQVLPRARQAGVCLHVTALPGRYGIGEIGADAYAFVDSMCRMGLHVWQFLPLGPTAYGDSPYQPLSTFAGNEMLIDVDDLLERGLVRRDETWALSALPADHVDYGQLIPAKNELLRLAAGRFHGRASSRQKARFDRFMDRHDDEWLHEYALFRILKARHEQRPWTEWQREYVHHDDEALKRLEAGQAERIEAIKIVQFLFHDQWQRLRAYANESGVRLFGDMPIYIAHDSSDAWANPELLRIDRDGRPDAVAGVPPDYFSQDGQLWGNPLYDWPAHAETGYRWWIERLRATVELADMVRVDHFRGFEGYWAIPADAGTARDGQWEPGPGDAIFDAMRVALGSLPIVAEDLGVITPEVEALRDRHRIPGMVVLQFDVTEEDFSLERVRENCVCYTGTHDNDTTLGWFLGSPDDIRSPDEIRQAQQAALAITSGTPETIATDLIRAAFSTAARLAIAPMQDFLGLGSESRFNTPGKSRNNWRWRLSPGQLSDDLCDEIADTVSVSGRELHNDRVHAAS
ncbi:MAG: 4-alpha-glucanotransferase [Woeseiaceae bacterium]|nr:4-alpha-glucanotransferase [Woeseiaceae bacterium]